MSKLANPEEVLREVIWYGAHRYDDKPSQFWNQMRIAAEALGDTEAASIFAAYCENGCPLTREQEQAERTLAALREPSVGAVDAAWAVYQAQTWWDERDDMSRAIIAAVAAAEQEVGG